MKYRINLMVNITPLAEDDGPTFAHSNSLYHQETFEIQGGSFPDIAPTIDGLYRAVHDVVEANR